MLRRIKIKRRNTEPLIATIERALIDRALLFAPNKSSICESEGKEASKEKETSNEKEDKDSSKDKETLKEGEILKDKEDKETSKDQ